MADAAPQRVVKRSLSIAGHRTSVSLEEAFWTRLRAVAAARGGSVAALVAAIDAPVNVGAFPGLPDLAELARIGVARVSTATRLAMLAFSAAREAARALRSGGRWDVLDAPLGYVDMQRLFPQP